MVVISVGRTIICVCLVLFYLCDQVLVLAVLLLQLSGYMGLHILKF